MSDAPEDLLVKRLQIYETEYNNVKADNSELIKLFGVKNHLLRELSTFIPDYKYLEKMCGFLPFDEQGEFLEHAKNLDYIKGLLSENE